MARSDSSTTVDPVLSVRDRPPKRSGIPGAETVFPDLAACCSGVPPVKTIRLVLGDQLNESHSWYERIDPHVLYVLMEIRSETDYTTHHIQKILAVFAAMRRFALRLNHAGHRVLYLTIRDERNRQRFVDNLSWIVFETGAQEVQLQEPDDYRLRQELDPQTVKTMLNGTESNERRRDPEDIRESLSNHDIASQHAGSPGVTVCRVSSEHFLISRESFDRYLDPARKPVMEYFYRRVRKSFGWLMEDAGKPAGGRWNLDSENRGKWNGGPRDPNPPEPYHAGLDLSEEFRDIQESGCGHFGSSHHRDFPWPVTRPAALQALDQFCRTALPHFGTYQDAMHTGQTTLFHSQLSFPLNVKLLSPAEVVERAIQEWKERTNEIALNQIEGFVRQVVGWREYMRVLYWRLMPGLADAQALDADQPLPGWYWTGKTDMACLAHTIRQSLEQAYAHHIQRLMITGNFAMLLGVRPDEVDRWYLGIYIDAFDWVERPNTRGMSQFADGGVVGTKPYAASASYIRRQSDYCRGCRYDSKTQTEDDSCPFNALYWHFYLRNEELRANRRVSSFVYSRLDKLDSSRIQAIQTRAAWIRSHSESL